MSIFIVHTMKAVLLIVIALCGLCYAQYDVVFDGSGLLLGQIIGSPVNVTAAQNNVTFYLCIAVNSSITVNTTYNISDFGVPRNGNTSDLAALNISAVGNSTYICGNITADTFNATTAVYPIDRLYYSLVSTTTTTTTGATTTTTTTTTTHRDHDRDRPNEDTKLAIGISVGIAGLLGVIAVVFICLVVSRRNEYSVVVN